MSSSVAARVIASKTSLIAVSCTGPDWNRTSGKLNGGEVCSTNCPVGLINKALSFGTLSLSQLPTKAARTKSVARTKKLFTKKMRILVIHCPARLKKLCLSIAASLLIRGPRIRLVLAQRNAQLRPLSVHLRYPFGTKFRNRAGLPTAVTA